MRGVSYQVAGRNDAAIEKFKIAANASALAPRAYWSMVSVDTESVSFQELERLLNHSAVPEQDKRYLWQSWGKNIIRRASMSKLSGAGSKPTH